MSAPRCPQCGRTLEAPDTACPACGHDASQAAGQRANRILTLILLFAVGVCIVGACLVFFRSGEESRRQQIIGDVVFVAGFAIYVVMRVVIFIRRRRQG